jgi:RNA polymerase sigma-70 factor, ECF subfamily
MGELMHSIAEEIPGLRRYALALVRSEIEAEDLVQECVLRAVSKKDLWQEGTDLRAWLFTMLHNHFVSGVRRSARQGRSVDIEDVDEETYHPPRQDKRLELRDLDRALALLPEDQRTVVLLIGLEGMDYTTAAKVVGVPVGTIRSRLSRGRGSLRRLMGIDPDGDDGAVVAQAA